MHVAELGHRLDSQTVWMRIPVGGPHAIWYQSGLMRGYTPNRTVRMPVLGSTVPDGLERITVSSSLDDFGSTVEVPVRPRATHSVTATEAPVDVIVRTRFEFGDGAASETDRRYRLGVPDPTAFAMKGLLFEGVPVINGTTLHPVTGGTVGLRRREDGRLQGRRDGLMHIVDGGRHVGAFDAITGRVVWQRRADAEAGTLWGPGGVGMSVVRSDDGLTCSIDGALVASVSFVDDRITVETARGTADIRLDAAGLVTSLATDGAETRCTYDDDGRLVALASPNGELAFRRVATDDGYEVGATDGEFLDRRVRYTFESDRTVIERRCCGTDPTTTVRGESGTEVQRPDGTTVSTEHNRDSSVVTTTLPSGDERQRTERMAGDGNVGLAIGNGTWETYRDPETGAIVHRSPAGYESRFEFDERGRVVRHRDFGGAITTYEWSGPTRVTVGGAGIAEEIEVIDIAHTEITTEAGVTAIAMQGPASSRRSGSGVVLQVTTQGDTVSVEVDGVSYLTRRAARNGYETTHSGRVIEAVKVSGALREVVSDGTVEVTFDEAGRPIGVAGDDLSRSFEWDRGGRLTGVADKRRSTAHRWDGNELSVVSSKGDVDCIVEFSRSPSGVVESISIAEERFEVETTEGVVTKLGPIAWTLDAEFRRPKSARCGVVDEEFGYDDVGRLVSQTVAVRGEVVFERSLEFTAGGRLARERHDGASAWERTVDYRNEFVSEVSGTNVEAFEFDPRGRLTGLAGRVIEVDEGGKPLAVDGTAILMTDAGRIQQMSVDGVLTEFAFNELGEVVGVTRDGARTEVGRDAFGRVASLGDVGIIWDQSRPVASFDTDGAVRERYLRATPGITPDVVVRGDRLIRVVSDEVGTPLCLIDTETGDMEFLQWSAYGQQTAGPTDFLFGFGGGLRLGDGADVFDMGVRTYVADLGRWVQWDPMLHRGGGTDLYGYAGGDPINFHDPTGRTVELCRDHEGLRHRWIKTDAYEAGQDSYQRPGLPAGFQTEWVDHSGRRGTKYKVYSCEVVDDVNEGCVDSKIKPGTWIGNYMFEPMYREFEPMGVPLDIPVPTICWNVAEEVLNDCRIKVGEDPRLVCDYGPGEAPPLPSPEPDFTPDPGVSELPEPNETPDRDHTPDLGFTPLDEE